jgi:hypothetical protein
VGAVRDLGIGRSTFYSLLKTDAGLMAASFMIGTSRVWAVEFLSLRANRGRQILTTSKRRGPPSRAGFCVSSSTNAPVGQT